MTGVERFSFAEHSYDRAFEEVHDKGAVHIPNFLNPSTLEELQEAIFKIKQNPSSGFFKYNGYDNGPILITWQSREKDKFPIHIVEDIEKFIRSYGDKYSALSNWKADHFTILDYRADSRTKPHRDPHELTGIGITLSIDGEADFTIHPHETEPATESWRLKPGDAVFLRMPGLNPNVSYSDEIAHGVDNPADGGTRTSLALRQFTPAPAFKYSDLSL